MIRFNILSRCLLLLVPLVLLGQGCTDKQQEVAVSPEQKAVRATFDQFRQAVLEKNSAAAESVLTRTSLDEYGKFKGLAVHSHADEVRGMSAMRKMFVLGLRHLSSADELEGMDPGDVFRFLMDHKMTMAPDFILHLDIAYIAVSGKGANAAVKFKDKPTDELSLLFLREDDEWKLDVGQLLMVADASISALAKQHNLSEDDLVIQALEAASGRKVEANVWEPLRP